MQTTTAQTTTGKNIFDFIIYGATLEGLLIGSYLHQKGFKTLVLEPSDKVGGFFSSAENDKATIPSIFTAPLSNENSIRLLDWLKSNLNLSDLNVNLKISQKELPPITFEKGHFEPFVGFGENAPPESEFLQDFLSAQRLEINPSANDWMKAIVTSGIEIRYNSNLTAININDKKITDITINDKTTLKAENFIYTQNPIELVEFFGPESLNPTAVSQKTISRLSKGTFWSTLQLSLAHEALVTDKEELHVLYGTQKNPTVSIGKFVGETSQWISFISSEATDINEEGVQILKEMKRQIKRAYPEALTALTFDKIALWPNTHGYIDLKSKRFGQLEGIDNICICSNHLVEHTNPFMGALTAVQYTAELLGELISSQVPERLETQSETNTLDA